MVKESRHLSGTTWNVYMFILTSKEAVGVREVGRGLKLSSPSLAQYHINKLVEMDLIRQTQEGYVVQEKARVEALRSFVLLRGRFIPRLVFYGALVAGMLVAYLMLGSFQFRFRDLIVLLVSLFSISAFFLEAVIQVRSLKNTVQKV
ncbi:MAG: hypothetical protein JSV35_03155 [Candidatus Bathyarchaeota archaeon]|nr:MAG: hypothetical protein JSV35_03155 [Candidatus Bathyarchaeota archaeon]